MKLEGLGVLGSGNSTGTDYHPQLGKVRYTVHQMGNDPDGQVGQTIGVMNRLVREDAEDPGFKFWVYSVVGGYGTQLDKVRRVWDHVKKSIRFQRDEVTGAGVGGVPDGEVVETIIRPVDMAEYVRQGIAVGDCDDFSMYLRAMLGVLGVESKFCTLAANGSAPGQFSHVYAVAYPVVAGGEAGEVGKGVVQSSGAVRVACDASHGNECGWEAPNLYGRREEWGNGDSGLLWYAVGFAAGWFGLKYLSGC